MLVLSLPPEEKIVTIKEALIAAREIFVPHDGYSIRTSPVFWTDVFVRRYGSFPLNDHDPRWDDLFSEGFPALRELLKKS